MYVKYIYDTYKIYKKKLISSENISRIYSKRINIEESQSFVINSPVIL